MSLIQSWGQGSGVPFNYSKLYKISVLQHQIYYVYSQNVLYVACYKWKGLTGIKTPEKLDLLHYLHVKKCTFKKLSFKIHH